MSSVPSPTDTGKNILSKNPEFSMKDLRAIIPKHLFQINTLHSLFYLVHDLVLVTITMYLGTFISNQYIPFVSLRIIASIIWFYIQGAFLTGLWVIAHECGHGGFANSKLLNTIIGFILHTMLLVPFFSWRYTHGVHHAKTNNLKLDTVHNPRMKHAKSPSSLKTKNRSALDRLTRILKLSVLGWPLYLCADVTGPPGHDDISFVNHFNPYCAYFPQYMINLVMVSDIGLILWIWILYRLYLVIGAANIIFYYFIPYLITNHWLVTITFLQHTDWSIDRYTPAEWSWLRGAFCSIDRDYGVFLNYAHHHIQDSHVVHHLFSSMPHYNAIEATKYLKNDKTLGKYYRSSNESWYGALWRIMGHGVWVKKDKDTVILANGEKNCKL